MFYLFTSTGSLRYRMDSLEVLAYPKGHLLRFRYEEELVSEDVRNLLKDTKRVTKFASPQSNEGLVIFMQPDGQMGEEQYSCFPLRRVRIVAIERCGTVYYIDFSLQSFVLYNDGPNGGVDVRLKAYRNSIQTLPLHPLPPLGSNSGRSKGYKWVKNTKTLVTDKNAEGSYGNFLTVVAPNDHGWVSLPATTDEERAWESVVEALCIYSVLARNLFFHVRGFFERGWWGKEVHIEPKVEGTTSIYPLPMGEYIVLKVLFYRPQKAPFPKDWTVTVDSHGEGFSGVSPKRFLVHSRYNEERVTFACKRVFDNVLSPVQLSATGVSVKQAASVGIGEPAVTQATTQSSAQQATMSNPMEVTATSVLTLDDGSPETPSPMLLAQVTASRPITWFTILLLGLASVFLTATPDFVKGVGQTRFMNWLWKWLAEVMQFHPVGLASTSKAVGAVCVIVAAYLALRRLPLGTSAK